MNAELGTSFMANFTRTFHVFGQILNEKESNEQHDIVFTVTDESFSISNFQ